jgi:hypothetical protein
MANLASMKFRDAFGFPVPGIPPQLYNTGSTGGTAVPVTASATQFRRWVFIGQTGSGATTTLWNFWIGGASASGGTFSALPATSTSTFSGSNSASATGTGSTTFGSQCLVVMDIRAEYIAGLNSGITWIKPIMSITTASAYAGVLGMGYLSEYEPASNYDWHSSTFVMQETDAF